MRRSLMLWIEFGIIFVMLPILAWMNLFKFPKFFLLFAVLVYCILMLITDKSFDRSKFWNRRGFKIRLILPKIVIVTLFLAAYTIVFEREFLFWIPKHNLRLWVVIMVLYPILSAYPQELIYRTYFFERYRRIFGKYLDILSIVAFCFLHIIYDNWIALVFSFAGGYMFTRTYRKSGSLALTAFEHAIYGALVFTLGLGKYFYEHWGA